jgi:Fe-S-cluster containining protein
VPKTVKKPKKTDCHRCSGLCCRYFALPIETPEDWDDFDDIRWYLYHEDISVFVEEGDWYINVKNKCQNLANDHKCAVYDLRPNICRKYKTDDCDFTGEEYDYQLHFTTAHQMEEYMKIKFGENVFGNLKQAKKKKKKSKKSEKPVKAKTK